MFTGIIEDLGNITGIQNKNDSISISIKSKILNDLKIGDSVSVNGVCLTVVKVDDDIFSCDVINETLSLVSTVFFSLQDI